MSQIIFSFTFNGLEEKWHGEGAEEEEKVDVSEWQGEHQAKHSNRQIEREREREKYSRNTVYEQESREGGVNMAGVSVPVQ